MAIKRQTEKATVYVKYIQSDNKANKIGFVACYTQTIADKLVKRGQVEIINAPEEKQLAAEQIGAIKDAAAVTKRKGVKSGGITSEGDEV
jgi:hypothetical protein